MFDQLYKAQRARERHLNAPLVDERIRYLSHWAAQGSTRSSLRVRAQDLLTIIEYLDVEAAGQTSEKQIINAADRHTPQGRRDYALLLFLYNTGARADEAAQLTIGNVELAQTPTRDLSSVQIHGKGNKLRRCPLWPHTASALTALLNKRAPHEHVFLNRCGRPITRFGIHTMVERYAKRVSAKLPALATKRVSPHSLRHTTATHLLRAG